MNIVQMEKMWSVSCNHVKWNNLTSLQKDHSRKSLFYKYKREELKMKKYLNISLIYAIAAMAGGVFYREFTKYNDFTGVTALGKVHAHLFFLGMLVFLIVALFAAHYDLTKCKIFRVFLWTYNIGVPLTAVMLLVRGVTQVLGLSLSTGLSAAISGIAGIGHVLVGVGMILLLATLKKTAKNGERAD